VKLPRFNRFASFGVLAAVALAFCPAVFAQGVLDRVGDALGGVAEGLNKVGEKAHDIVGSGLGFGDANGGGVVNSSEFSEKYPVAANAKVSIANEFGEIRVSTWDNEVVEVTARISVRSETADSAAELCKNIAIQVTPADNNITVRTVLPDMQNVMGKPTIEVHYEMTLPRDASLTCKNSFGDTRIDGVGGDVALDSSFGAVDVSNISGSVNLRARGEFPLSARNLAKGGVFEMHGVNAVLRNVAGASKISSFWGSLELRELTAESNIDAASESGPITLYLSGDSLPNITATALYGEVQSDVPLSQVKQGDVTVAKSENAASSSQVALRASFREIIIRREGEAQVAADPAIQTQPFKEVITRTDPVLDNSKIVVEAINGDVRVVGTDAESVRLTATKFVRVQSQSNARAALQALNVQSEATEGTLTIKTAVTDNMAALGCVSHRIDLTIECPVGASLEVHAMDGHTSVENLAAEVVVKQDAGGVSADHIKGAVSVSNQKGDIRATSCTGTVDATASFGTVSLMDVFGKMTTSVTQGKTIIETPHADIYARSAGGDIRILSLEGVAGNYDVGAEHGNISILIPGDSDASISATVEKGVVKSAIPLTGAIRQDVQEFVRNTPGQNRVTLQTTDGDIMIN
jgi:hypothetical protein